MAHDGTAINWSVGPNDPVLETVLYQKWSVKPMVQVAGEAADLKTDLGAVIANRDSAAIISYLSWLYRVQGMLA